MNKYRIVLVENDEDELLFMNEAFEASDSFEILARAKNGNVLFEWLEQQPLSMLPEVILSDLNMPGKNGYDILSEIQSELKYAHIKVIITSTSSIKSVIDKCISLGAADFIPKPETFIDYESFVIQLHKRIENNHPN